MLITLASMKNRMDTVSVAFTAFILLTSLVVISFTNQANALSDNVIASPNDGFDSVAPRVGVSGDNVYVVWQDVSLGNDEVFFASSSDNGATFGEPVNISSNDGSSASPQIAVSGDNVYVVWQDDSSGNLDIFLAASSDNGATFGEPVNISSNDGESSNPQIITSSSGNVYTIWVDNSIDGTIQRYTSLLAQTMEVRLAVRSI